MKNIKKIIILILVLCSFVGAYSQTKTTIRGKVIDQRDKTPIIGATVVESDKDNRVVNGTVTDIDGNFVYQMKNPANSMKVSVIGYQAKVIKPNPLKQVVIELISSDLQIEQFTVTAKQKTFNGLTNIDARDNATSTTKIDLMEMRNEGISSAADALQGKVAGLDIVSMSGDPGSGSSIVIRGLSSMGNAKPLIVIDGIPQDNVPSNFDLASANVEDIGNLISVALQDIKSIEVLKDAASTSLYGSKGGAGVLLIETNRGKMGKVQFDYTFKNTINMQPRAIPMLNGDEYTTLQLDEWHNAKGVYDLPNEIAYNKDFNDFYNYSANTDWLGAITQTGITNDHYFRVSGGGEKTRYSTSINYVDEGGTTLKTENKSLFSRINLDYFLSKKLMFSVNFAYNNIQTKGNYEIAFDNKVRQMAYKKAPNMSIRQYDDKGHLTGEYFTRNYDNINNYQGDGLNYYNPVAVVNLGKNDKNENKLETSFILKYNIFDWLVFRETADFQYTGRKENKYLPYNAIGQSWTNWTVNLGAEGNTIASSFKTESQLSFNIPFKNTDHVLSGAATWKTDQYQDENIYIESNEIPSTDITDPAVASHINWISSGSSENRSVTGLLNVNYKYKDRYGLTANLINEGNSAFGASNRWGRFAGLAAFWRFSSEPLLKNCGNWLSESKIKASWGLAGTAPEDPYKRYGLFVTSSPSYYITNPGAVPSNIQLDNLKWQSTTSTDLGIELNLLKDRLYIEGTLYKKVASDILFGKPWQGYAIPTSSGFSELGYFNGGEMKNIGWELMTGYKIIRTKDWLVQLDFNISQNVNTFTKLPQNYNTEKAVNLTNGNYPQRIQEGQSIGSFYGLRYLGVYASDADAVATAADGSKLYDGNHNPIPMTFPGGFTFRGGDAKYEDINHDGVIDMNDVVYIGNSNPTVMGGGGISFRYKQFDLNFQFVYRLGYDIINMTALNTQGMNGRNNQSKAVLSRWRVQGQDEPGLLPRAYMDSRFNNLGSDRYVENGSFVRLNSVKFGYNLSQDLCKKFGIQNANIAVSARKLFTITNYSGQDPEVGQDASDPFWIGADNANTPPPRTVTLSLSVAF
jgi:TonB-linked SusC/RagA family outer membrane protein